MKRTRQDRRDDFDEFYKNSETAFKTFRDNDKDAEKFERLYMLCVCPGSRAGGTNNRVVEVFWGSRPFETITEGRSWRALSEYGATLLFERDDSGFVTIVLYPAGTENRKPVETSIFLHQRIDPVRLKNSSFLKSLWSDFMAYMEYTSLDGHPTTRQKMRIGNLRFFKHMVIDNTWKPTRVSERLKTLLTWVFTVGLSGLIVFFVNRADRNPVETQLKQTNIRLDSMLKSLHCLSKLPPVNVAPGISTGTNRHSEKQEQK